MASHKKVLIVDDNEAIRIALRAILRQAGFNVVGAEYKVNLLAPAAGPALLAHGHVLKPGRRLIVCRADISFLDAEGQDTLCAIAQGAMAVFFGEGLGPATLTSSISASVCRLGYCTVRARGRRCGCAR